MTKRVLYTSYPQAMAKTHQHILVPVDFSNHAVLALKEAADLAHKYQADLTVVYVIPQAIFHPERAAEVEYTIDISDIAKEAQKTLTDMTAPYRQEGLAITEHMLSGGTHVEIVRVAQRVKAYLIVIGAHGEAGAKPILISVAEKVMREAPCSVMTVQQAVAAAA